MVTEIHIITWESLDKPSWGIVGAYSDKELAEKDLTLLGSHGDPAKVFKILSVEVEGS